MVWSVTGSGSGSTGGSTMSYSTVVHYFEHNQVTSFTLDRNTSVITLNLKEGDLPLPDVSSTQSTVQSTGGLLSGMFSSSSESTGAVQEDDGTVTVRYKLPYAYVFIENVDKYIESYDAAKPRRAHDPTTTPLSRRPSPGWRSSSIWGCWAAPAFCCSR